MRPTISCYRQSRLIPLHQYNESCQLAEATGMSWRDVGISGYDEMIEVINATLHE